jgi:hypothetical protein
MAVHERGNERVVSVLEGGYDLKGFRAQLPRM